mmetsp:Transcript_22912/g.68101  ORF Transcript_22912/g.68101 Transcript_22912/m.68101 type:complete len:304 (-) Transcript_22912:289-1200(-)
MMAWQPPQPLQRLWQCGWRRAAETTSPLRTAAPPTHGARWGGCQSECFREHGRTRCMCRRRRSPRYGELPPPPPPATRRALQIDAADRSKGSRGRRPHSGEARTQTRRWRRRWRPGGTPLTKALVLPLMLPPLAQVPSCSSHEVGGTAEAVRWAPARQCGRRRRRCSCCCLCWCHCRCSCRRARRECCERSRNHKRPCRGCRCQRRRCSCCARCLCRRAPRRPHSRAQNAIRHCRRCLRDVERIEGRMAFLLAVLCSVGGLSARAAGNAAAAAAANISAFAFRRFAGQPGRSLARLRACLFPA